MRFRWGVTTTVGLLLGVGLLGIPVKGDNVRSDDVVLVTDAAPTDAAGRLQTLMVKNLASHWGKVKVVEAYRFVKSDRQDGEPLIYVGTERGSLLTPALVESALNGPTLWLGENLWQVPVAKMEKLGLSAGSVDTSAVTSVEYKGIKLPRAQAAGGVKRIYHTTAGSAKVIASGLDANGASVEYAVSSGQFTYIAEVGFSYGADADRSLVLADRLGELMGATDQPATKAMVRLEDVGPDTDPAKLRTIGEYLCKNTVPFSVAVYPRYKDPLGRKGNPGEYTLAQRPNVVRVLREMVECGATLVLHGWTHQYAEETNPYDGVSADDFEFYRAHLDDSQAVVLDGPVAEDSAAWARGRLTSALADVKAAGLPTPLISEFPHYAASSVDYMVAGEMFDARYERPLYYPSDLDGPHANVGSGQTFPYAVRDNAGIVVPENLGHYAAPVPGPGGTIAGNKDASSGVDQITNGAARMKVVRGGVSSFFYHPSLGLGALPEIIKRIQAQQYVFVSPSDIVGELS